jgi:hypothetical protein
MQEPGVSASLMRDIDASLHRLQGDRRAAALQIVIEGKSNEEAAQGSVQGRCRFSAGSSRPTVRHGETGCIWQMHCCSLGGSASTFRRYRRTSSRSHFSVSPSDTILIMAATEAMSWWQTSTLRGRQSWRLKPIATDRPVDTHRRQHTRALLTKVFRAGEGLWVPQIRRRAGGTSLWLSQEGIPMRCDARLATDKGKVSTIRWELRHVKIGTQDAALFEVPHDYARLPAEAAAPLLGMRLARPPAR